jgi:hypothetical protein
MCLATQANEPLFERLVGSSFGKSESQYVSWETGQQTISRTSVVSSLRESER